ncbi:MAG TPA: ribonuclease R [Candidatus Paceibacterota bacterium]
MSKRRFNSPARPVSHGVRLKSTEGIIQLTARGMGYVPYEGHEDIEIEKENLGTALNGDRVSIVLTGLKPRPRGKVSEVLERKREEFVGTLGKTSDGGWILVPDDRRFYTPIRIIQSDTSVLKPNIKALVRLAKWAEGGQPEGVVISALGEKGTHRVEMNSIVLEHGFRTDYPAEVNREAQVIEKEHARMIEAEAPKRVDFRGVTTMTIDPADAKDFDDALSFRELANGTFEVGIHIADVTHFVTEGSALDREAEKRGTSVYLVDATIPMLPEELSGNVCSLREGEDRLTFSAIFILNASGKVLDRRFAKTIIHSDKRFTYEEAQDIIDATKGLFAQELLTLNKLAILLKEKRANEGAIDFDQDEVKFKLDENGKPLGVVRKVRLATHMLVEEFMLLANREVAFYVHDLLKKVPESDRLFIYRIHDTPKEDRIEELSIYLKAVGYELSKAKKPSARDFKRLFGEIEGKPEESLIKTATIRSMAKAIYSTKNIGHFGLSFKHYTHFTSPIRRYPDMMAHRILFSHLEGSPIGAQEFGRYERLAILSSESEAEAVAAERESIKYKQVEYMGSKVGEEFDAVISGVAEWGVYVEEKISKSEGLVRMRSLQGDYYILDRKRYAVVGSRTKKTYTLGDPIRVKLIESNLDTRTLEFSLV